MADVLLDRVGPVTLSDKDRQIARMKLARDFQEVWPDANADKIAAAVQCVLPIYLHLLETGTIDWNEWSLAGREARSGLNSI